MSNDEAINFSSGHDVESGKQVNINDTVRRAMDELEIFLNRTDTTNDAAKREELMLTLRKLLKEDIEQSHQDWFKYGFHIGHLYAYKEGLLKGEIPVTLHRTLERRFSEPDKTKTKFTVSSTIKSDSELKIKSLQKNTAPTSIAENEDKDESST